MPLANMRKLQDTEEYFIHWANKYPFFSDYENAAVCRPQQYIPFVCGKDIQSFSMSSLDLQLIVTLDRWTGFPEGLCIFIRIFETQSFHFSNFQE